MDRTKTGGYLLLAVLFTVTVMSGCIKNVSNYSSVDRNAYVEVMNLTSKTPAVEMYLNGNKATSPMASNSFFSLYSALKIGSYTVDFKKAPSDSLMANIPSMSYDSANFYTLLVYRDTSAGVKATRIQDDFSVLTTDKFYYRFFNMSPETGPVDFYIDSNKVATNRWPADNVRSIDYNTFVGYAPGYHALKIKLASKDSVVATASNVSFDPGNAYTIFLRGVAGGTGHDALGLDVFKAAK